MNGKVNVLITDDHPIYCSGIVNILKTLPSVGKVGECHSGKEAIRILEQEPYDIILLDIAMPEMSGIEASKIIKERFPATDIIILTSSNSRRQIVDLLNLGVSGYVLKNTDKKELVDAINNVQNKILYLTPEVKRIYTDFLLEHSMTKHGKGDEIELTTREVQVLKQICQQCTTNEIAKNLHLAPATINNHRYNIGRKIGTNNVVGFVLFAIRNGYFSPSQPKT